jgi:hypothetical protein
MLAGTWALVLLLLIEALRVFGWVSGVCVPNALACDPVVYQPLIFCVGVVLLFSKERGRRPGKLDWTRRWGVVCSYVVLLLSAAEFFYVAAYVLLGVAALFQSIPLRYQPQVTQLFVDVSTACLRYGPHAGKMSAVVLVAFSSTAILLACVPLFDALRSSGPKRVAAILLAPLALFSLMHLAQAGRYGLGYSIGIRADVSWYRVYFLLVLERYRLGYLGLGEIVVEAAKWCIMLAIAIWLSIAQFAAWRKGARAETAPAAAPRS